MKPSPPSGLILDGQYTAMNVAATRKRATGMTSNKAGGGAVLAEKCHEKLGLRVAMMFSCTKLESSGVYIEYCNASHCVHMKLISINSLTCIKIVKHMYMQATTCSILQTINQHMKQSAAERHSLLRRRPAVHAFFYDGLPAHLWCLAQIRQAPPGYSKQTTNWCTQKKWVPAQVKGISHYNADFRNLSGLHVT